MNVLAAIASPAAQRDGAVAAAPALLVRTAGVDDLSTVNAIVDAAVDTWALPERVRRLSAPSLRYGRVDLTHMEILLAENETGQAVGAAALEHADEIDTPEARRALLLHGLYVRPARQRSGVGAHMVRQVMGIARARGVDGVSTRVWRESEAFFVALGFVPFGDAAAASRHPRRMWKPLS